MFRITMLPAEDGDCLLVEVGAPASPFRILIDGGRKSSKPHLDALLATLPARPAPAIDIMVLTHVDADHIEGLLELLVDETPLTVGDVWFNGGNHLAAARGIAAPLRRQPQAAHADQPPIKVLSIKQGIDFENAIAARGWHWNKAFKAGPIMTDGAELPKVPVGDGLLTLIGPPKKKLAAFAPEWAAKMEDMRAKDMVTLKGRDRPVPRPDNIAILAKAMDTADVAKPNGTSIAFVIAHGRRRALFAADAHPGDIADAIDAFEPGAKRVRFDAIKVAHHGSAHNNTSKLIGRLESSLWLISTSGSHHEHPDPEAIARIVLASPPKDKIIAFNYKTSAAEWAGPDLIKAYGYRTEFPSEEKPLRVEISGKVPVFG